MATIISIVTMGGLLERKIQIAYHPYVYNLTRTVTSLKRYDKNRITPMRLEG